MDFTREPIIETVITPREGYRLVVRNSKNASQEEHFVDAVEVVSFGNAFFFRSIERPRPFMVPIGDYEVLEVRESRIVLKTPHMQEGSVKIGPPQRESKEREAHRSRQQQEPMEEGPQEGVRYEGARGEGGRSEGARSEGTRSEATRSEATRSEGPRTEGNRQEGGRDKRRDRRRSMRRRRGQMREEDREPAQEGLPQEGGYQAVVYQEGAAREISEEEMMAKQSAFLSGEEAGYQVGALVGREASALSQEAVIPTLRSVLPPPTTLIRDDLQRLRDNEMYKGAFFIREEREEDDDDASLESFSVEAQSAETQATKESSPEESFLFQQAAEKDIDRDVEDPLSR